MNKRKMSLMATLGVSLFAVVAASVSTYAWYQATASASISASPSECEITVSKPKDYTFWVYKGNRVYDYDGDGEDDTFTPSSPESFENDFAAVTPTNKNDLVNLTGLCPGKSYLFCVSAENLTSNASISLTLNSIISNDSTKQQLTYKRYVRNSDGGAHDIEVNVGWAIDIYTMQSWNGAGYQSFLTSTTETDRFDFNYSRTFTTSAPNKDPLSNAGSGDGVNKAFNISIDPIYSGTVAAGKTTAYVFYRVYFANSQALSFLEVDKDTGGKVIGSSPNKDRHYLPLRPQESTPFYLIGSFNSNKTEDPNYAMEYVTSGHYCAKGIKLAAGATLNVYNPNGANNTEKYITCASTWEGCGFTLDNSTPKKLQVTTAGVYNVHYYASPATANNYVVLEKTAIDASKDYDSNCFQGLKFAMTSMTFTF